MIYQIFGIAILLAFYAVYFIKMLSQRKKGIKTDQIGRDKTGFVKFVEITMKIAVIAVLIAELISIVINTAWLPDWARIIGGVIGFAGVGIFIASVITMRDSWRAGVSNKDKTELITDKIYRYSRNPAFLGFDLVYTGILIMFFNPYLLFFSLFAMIMLHLQIVNVEEDFLIVSFGEEYVSYKRSVNRYLGRKTNKKP